MSGKFGREGTADGEARRTRSAFPPVDLERAYDMIDALRAVAARHGTTVARVALAWVLAQPGVTSAILGAKRPEQLEENLAAVDLELTEEDLAELDAVSALPVEYPAWIQDGGAYRLPPDGLTPAPAEPRGGARSVQQRVPRAGTLPSSR
ncbi:aldo/keto reductase [Microbispora corallina]|uniref:aldo/keto reductase n=1 Tax=Microbispora corallina TaxID=83302 RepID=UPI001EF33056